MKTISSIDGHLLIAFQKAFSCEWLTPIIKFITHLGDRGAIWIAIAILLLVFKRTRKAGIIAICALLGSLIINNIILKNLVARTRPYEMFDEVKRLIEIQRDFSFPSGHSGSSFAAATSIYLGLSGKLKKKIGIASLTLASIIALSRLYVGVHYPSDVIFGAINGIIIAIGVNKLFEYAGKGKSLGEDDNDKYRK